MIIKRLEVVFPSLLLLLYTLAHALVALSLLAFGLQADGWVLHPVAVAWYALFILGSLLLLVRARRDETSPWPLVIPPLLVLAALGAFPATGALGGARYQPYDLGDIQATFLIFNILGGLAMASMALLYRWPRLLLAWAVAQGLLLATYPVWWAGLWRWGMLGVPVPTGALFLGLPLLYALAALALGLRFPRRWGQSILAGLAVGVALAILAGVRHPAYLRGQSFRSEVVWEMWLGFAAQVPLFLAFGALLLPLPLLAWRVLREWPVEAEGRRFPWEALTLTLWAAPSLAIPLLTLGYTLPAAGSYQGWAGVTVPDAWLPTIIWAGWLFTAVLWLLLPYALLGLVSTLRFVRLRPALPTFPGALLWMGVGWLAAFAWDLSPLSLPLHVVWETPSAIDAFLPLLGGPLLLLVGRGWDVARFNAPTCHRYSLRTLAQMATLSLLLAFITWMGRAAWAYGRVLFAPLPAWADRWQYAPLPPAILATLGLVLHLTLIGLGLFALGQTLLSWVEAERKVGRRVLELLARATALPLLVIAALATFGWWATAPALVRTVPPNGAIDVPRDTVVLIEMAPETQWLGLLLGGSGSGIRSRYADTGDYIPGMTGGTGTGFFLDPEGLLRPNAPVEVTVHRTGERPYTLRFTTAGVGSPTATPMPDFRGFPGPKPTPMPTPAPPGEAEAIGYLRPAPSGTNYAFELDTAQGPVQLVLAEERQRGNLTWLMEHRYLTLVRGRWLSRDPPTLEVAWNQGAARSFNRSTPLAETYTDSLHGYAIEHPAGWMVERVGEIVLIQNFRLADFPQGYDPREDPSLYMVGVVTEGKSLDQVRKIQKEQDVVDEKERAAQVNGRAALRLTRLYPDGRRQHQVLVDWNGRTLMLHTFQDPALFERMVETLRPASLPR
ncbi:MAG: hypothetical protein AB1566_11410 [Chloroflexota bacterium]